VRESARG